MLDAMRAKDAQKLSLIRLMLSFITNKEIDKGIKGSEDLGDADVIAVLKSMVKSREHVIAQYEQSNDTEAIEKERQEINLIKEFLPVQYDKEKLEAILEEIIEVTGATSIKDMGKIMSAISAREDNSSIDRSLVSAILKSKF